MTKILPINDETTINTIQFLSGEDVNKIQLELESDTIYVVYYNANNDEIYRLYYEDVNDNIDKQAYDNAIDLSERNR